MTPFLAGEHPRWPTRFSLGYGFPMKVMAFLKGKITFPDLGLLIIRLGIGTSLLLFHGWGKLMGGSATWEAVGGNMANLGLDFWPGFWGLMAALSESVGSICLALGVFFRPAAALLAFTMLVATARHLSLPADASNAGWSGASHALELLSVYLGLFLTGPGRFTILGKRS